MKKLNKTYSNDQKDFKKKKQSNQKYTQIEATEEYSKRGCELLSEYKNNKVKNKYKCICGSISYNTINDIKNGHLCKKCGIKKAAEKRRLKLNEVIQFFSNNKCSLLTNDYQNKDQVLDFICSCGNPGKKRFGDFKKAPWCRECGIILKRLKLNKSISEVRIIFKNNGCKLLTTTYINNKQTLNYICECGSASTTTLNNFLAGHRCKKCSSWRIRESLSLKYEYVFNFFRENGCYLLSNEYVNNHQKLKYRCICNRISTSTFNNFKNGVRCKECGIQKNRISFRFSMQEVYWIFREANCHLLSSNYINSRQLLKFKCSCGNISSASLHDFQTGKRCTDCGIQKRRNAKKFTLEEVKRQFAKHGHRYLDDKYENSSTPHLYQCSCGQTSRITLSSMKAGRTCGRGKCSIRKGEMIVREFFEKVYESRFDKCRPEWLLNTDRNRLELDGYNEKLKIAFEHQGKQHSEENHYFHTRKDDYYKLVMHDEIKRQLCSDKGILLILVPELFSMLKPSELPSYIEKLFLIHGQKLPSNFYNISINNAGTVKKAKAIKFRRLS